MTVRPRRIHVLVFSVSVLTLLLCAGCHGQLDTTRAELKKKVEQLERKGVTPEQFFKEVGTEPHRIDRLGKRRYWYFYCTDGYIIVTVKKDVLDKENRVEYATGIRVMNMDE